MTLGIVMLLLVQAAPEEEDSIRCETNVERQACLVSFARHLRSRAEEVGLDEPNIKRLAASLSEKLPPPRKDAREWGEASVGAAEAPAAYWRKCQRALDAGTVPYDYELENFTWKSETEVLRPDGGFEAPDGGPTKYESGPPQDVHAYELNECLYRHLAARKPSPVDCLAAEVLDDKTVRTTTDYVSISFEAKERKPKVTSPTMADCIEQLSTELAAVAARYVTPDDLTTVTVALSLRSDKKREELTDRDLIRIDALAAQRRIALYKINRGKTLYGLCGDPPPGDWSRLKSDTGEFLGCSYTVRSGGLSGARTVKWRPAPRSANDEACPSKKRPFVGEFVGDDKQLLPCLQALMKVETGSWTGLVYCSPDGAFHANGSPEVTLPDGGRIAAVEPGMWLRMCVEIARAERGLP